MAQAPNRLPKHPVEKVLRRLKKTPSWLAREAREDESQRKQLVIRICDVFAGRRLNFSKRDGLDIYRVLEPLTDREELDISKVICGRPSAPRPEARNAR